MHVHAGHSGAQLPFERDRRLVLRRLPVGAVITRAALTLTPVSTDPAHRFLETLAFPAGSGAGDWGASKVVTTGAVEVALHARRRLASLTGSGLASGPLLVDLGGGFGHFYAYAPTKMAYPIDRFAMEVKRQMDVLDRRLAESAYLAGDAYSIADIAVWPWLLVRSVPTSK